MGERIRRTIGGRTCRTVAACHLASLLISWPSGIPRVSMLVDECNQSIASLTTTGKSCWTFGCRNGKPSSYGVIRGVVREWRGYQDVGIRRHIVKSSAVVLWGVMVDSMLISNAEEFTDDELLQSLVEFVDPDTTAPSRTRVQQADTLPRPQVYEAAFGTVAYAAKKAGLDPRFDPGTYQYTERDLIDALREFAVTVDETPTYRQVDAADDMPATSTYENRFGGWNAALRAAGLTLNQPSWSSETVSNGELLTRLQEFGARLGETPSRRQVNAEDDLPSVTTYRRRFGSWTAALGEAGFTLRPEQEQLHGLSDDELLARLRDFAAAHDDTPTRRAVADADDIPSPWTYYTRFGSWTAALRKAGLE